MVQYGDEVGLFSPVTGNQLDAGMAMCGKDEDNWATVFEAEYYSYP